MPFGTFSDVSGAASRRTMLGQVGVLRDLHHLACQKASEDKLVPFQRAIGLGCLAMAVSVQISHAADNGGVSEQARQEATSLQGYASALYLAHELGYGHFLKSLGPSDVSRARIGTRGWYLATSSEKDLDEASARAFEKMATVIELEQAAAILRTPGGQIAIKDFRNIAQSYGTDLLAYGVTLPNDQRSKVQEISDSPGWKVIKRINRDPRFMSLLGLQ